MEAQIKKIISNTSNRYHWHGYHQRDFYDMTLSVVSWLALSIKQQARCTASSEASDCPSHFSDVMSQFDKQKIATTLKNWESYQGKSWKGLLRLELSLIEHIPDTDWQFILTIWYDLFTEADMDVFQLVLKVFDQLDEVIAIDQKDEHMHLTPTAVTSIMAQYLGSDQKGILYDPFARTGNLLSEAVKKLPSVDNAAGFSPIKLGCKLANLRLLFTSQTLTPSIKQEQQAEPEIGIFDFIISNPPFGHQRIDEEQLRNISNEWSDLARKSNRKEIYYLCHILSHLADGGKASILLPGIFLSGSLIIKELIRRLLEKNILDAVIALPTGLFMHTGIPIVLVAINKNRRIEDRILLADASTEAHRNGRQNILKTEKIENWLRILKSQSYKGNTSSMIMVAAEDIIQRDYNLYVAAYRKEDSVIKNRTPSTTLKREYEALEAKIALAKKDLVNYLSEKTN